jgi:hypothetical protein
MQDSTKVLNSSWLKLNNTCQQVAVETAIGSSLSKEADALINCTAHTIKPVAVWVTKNQTV